MNTRFVHLLTATALIFSLPACAATQDVDLLSYDQATPAPLLAQPDAAPVELTPPVVTETPAPAPKPAPEKKAEPAPPKVKKTALKKPAAQKTAAPVKTVPDAPKPTEKPAEKPAEKPVEKPAAPKPLLLKAGDVIRIDVKDEPDLSGSFPISPDGNINLPLIGARPAAAMTLIDLKNAITAAYKDGYLVDPKISLSKEVSP